MTVQHLNSISMFPDDQKSGALGKEMLMDIHHEQQVFRREYNYDDSGCKGRRGAGGYGAVFPPPLEAYTISACEYGSFTHMPRLERVLSLTPIRRDGRLILQAAAEPPANPSHILRSYRSNGRLQLRLTNILQHQLYYEGDSSSINDMQKIKAAPTTIMITTDEYVAQSELQAAHAIRLADSNPNAENALQANPPASLRQTPAAARFWAQAKSPSPAQCNIAAAAQAAISDSASTSSNNSCFSEEYHRSSPKSSLLQQHNMIKHRRSRIRIAHKAPYYCHDLKSAVGAAETCGPDGPNAQIDIKVNPISAQTEQQHGSDKLSAKEKPAVEERASRKEGAEKGGRQVDGRLQLAKAAAAVKGAASWPRQDERRGSSGGTAAAAAADASVSSCGCWAAGAGAADDDLMGSLTQVFDKYSAHQQLPACKVATTSFLPHSFITSIRPLAMLNLSHTHPPPYAKSLPCPF